MISVTILNKNGQRTLENVLQSVSRFDEVILLDTGSTDKSLEIAKQFTNVSIHHHPFTGFGPLHNYASSLAKHSWILSIDSDEVLSKELCNEILVHPLNEQYVYSFPMNNYFNGKLIRHCGWYPDRHIRLYNKNTTCFSDAFVHEGILTKGLKEHPFNNPVLHYSYEGISDFLLKMQRYSDLFAQQNKGKKKSSLRHAIFHGIGAFLKTYILKKGFLDAYEGFVISTYNANTAFYKYLKLKEQNEKLHAHHTHVPQNRDRKAQ